eukprot:1194107-Prorocentrum_minimum.AAC.3
MTSSCSCGCSDVPLVTQVSEVLNSEGVEAVHFRIANNPRFIKVFELGFTNYSSSQGRIAFVIA